MEYTLGVDFSIYQDNVNYYELKKNGNIQFGIFRTSSGDGLIDSQAEEHSKGFKSEDMITGSYHWLDPIDKPEIQMDIYLRLIDKYNPDFVCLDIEQYWKNWNEYSLMLKGQLNTPIQKFSDSEITKHATTAYNYLLKRTQKPVVLYSAAWFTNSYAKSLTNLLQNNFWVASYFDYGKTAYKVNWEQFKNLIPVNKKPQMPYGMSITENNPKFWQFSSRIILPCSQYNYDFDLFFGNLEDLKKFCNLEVNTMSLEEWAVQLDIWARKNGFEGKQLKI
jgi:GH25 family lysozyme M1 (1,4-beta-N-acetylmuramidase)